jgi:hypothetical protein
MCKTLTYTTHHSQDEIAATFKWLLGYLFISRKSCFEHEQCYLEADWISRVETDTWTVRGTDRTLGGCVETVGATWIRSAPQYATYYSQASTIPLQSITPLTNWQDGHPRRSKKHNSTLYPIRSFPHNTYGYCRAHTERYSRSLLSTKSRN